MTFSTCHSHRWQYICKNHFELQWSSLAVAIAGNMWLLVGCLCLPGAMQRKQILNPHSNPEMRKKQSIKYIYTNMLDFVSCRPWIRPNRSCHLLRCLPLLLWDGKWVLKDPALLKLNYRNLERNSCNSVWSHLSPHEALAPVVLPF